jgi:hypothetical protein
VRIALHPIGTRSKEGHMTKATSILAAFLEIAITMVARLLALATQDMIEPSAGQDPEEAM